MYTKMVFLLLMSATLDLTSLNQRFTPHTDSKVVMATLQPMLQQLREFFDYACVRATEHFAMRGWTYDGNLFAYEVRKDVYERLKALGADISETDDPEASFALEKMALSGLLLKLPKVELRIRKSKDSEVPAAGSDQLLGFYNWNLFAFEEITGQEPDDSPLHLVLLWNLDTNRTVSNFWLVCPRGESYGEVKLYWRELVPAAEVNAKDHGREFRDAFQEANSDVPISPKDKKTKEGIELPTGTDKKRQ